jgi:uncharacterized protein with PIN domain/sulfur carrier protein ThiS
MKVAHFEIEDKLHWLLPYDKRRADFEYPFNGPQSVKHLIESVGIPHTEIGKVKANGEAIGPGYLVQDGDRIEVKAVLPAGDQSAEPRFVIDGHLGRLAAYLRMLGLDSLYHNDYEDRELVRVAVGDGRILLTRDRRLLMHKNITSGQLLRSLEPEEQLREVIQRQALKKWIRPFQRCIRCNHPLDPVRKEEVLERLQPLTKLYFEEFHICPACRQIYWKGSHYERMQKIIEGIGKG